MSSWSSDVGSCLSPDGDAAGSATKMHFGIHPHMLRHSTGFKLANQGVDTRAINAKRLIRRSFGPDSSTKTTRVSK
jgi:integrase